MPFAPWVVLLCCLATEEPRILFDPGTIDRSLVHMKDRLGARYDTMTKALETFQTNSSQGSEYHNATKAYNATLHEVLIKEEIQELYAYIVCHNRGYFFFSNKYVATYLELSRKQTEEMAKIVANMTVSMEDHVTQRDPLNPSDLPSLFNSFYEKNMATFTRDMNAQVPAQSQEKLRRLCSTFDMKKIIEKDFQSLALTIVTERNRLRLLRLTPINLMDKFTANFIVLTDSDEFLNALELTPEQSKEMKQLFAQCMETMGGLQDAYVTTLQQAKRDPTEFFFNISSKKCGEYNQAMAKILNVQQKKRLLELRCQILGPSYAFNEVTAPLTGITQEQQNSVNAHSMLVHQQNAALFRTMNDSAESKYVVMELISKKLLEEFFAEEQPKNWDKMLGKKLPDEVLKRLKLVYYQRTRFLF